MSKDTRKHLKASGGYNNLRTNNSSFKAQSRMRTVENWRKADRKEASNSRQSILTIVLMILLCFAVIGVLSNKDIMTFRGFLEFLQTCPSIPLDFLQINLEGTIPILSFLGTLVNAITFILTCIINALTMVFWFLRALFL